MRLGNAGDDRMAIVLSLLFWSAWAIVAASAAYLLLAIGCVAAFRAPPPPVGAPVNGVALLKPLCGLEAGLATALRSFLSQQVDAPVHHVFGVADPDDPALALARAVAAEFPDRRVAFVADPRSHGPNPKVSNLLNMLAVAEGEVIVLSDSDIVVRPGSLQAVIDGLAAPGVGAVTALYRGRPGPAAGLSGRLAALYIDAWFLPKAVVHARLIPLGVTYGPLTAVRRDTLARIGGLETLAGSLSDDAELGRRVRALGLSIAFAPMAVETLANDANLPALFAHELRWARTARGLDPAGYLPTLVTHPGPIPLLLFLARPDWASLGAVLAPIALRWALARLVWARFGRADGMVRLLPPALWWRDQLAFAVWLAGAFTRRVAWRGQRLAVGDDAAIVSA